MGPDRFAFTGPAALDAARPAPALPAAVPARWRWAVALCWLLAGPLYLLLPPGPDQFNHLYMGWRLLEGDVPYVDLIDQNWPGVWLVHAVAVALFGTELVSWRLMDLLLFAACAAALADIVRHGAGRTSAWVLAGLAPWFYLACGYWVAGQHDMTAAQFAVIGLWCHVRAQGRPATAWHAAAGMLIGAALLNKPTMGALLALWPAQALLSGRPWRGVARDAVMAWAAAGTTVGAAVALMGALGTPFAALWESIFVLNAHGLASESPPLAKVLRTTGAWPMVLTALCLPAAAALWRQRHAQPAALALHALWITGVVSYAVQARGFSYHLAPMILSCMGLLAISLRWAAGTWARAGTAAGARAAGLALVVLLGAGIGQRLWSSFHRLPAAIAASDLDIHFARFTENSGLKVGDAIAFARRVEQTDTTGCVLLVGDSSAINVLARRRLSTRFYYFPVIRSARPPLPMAERWVAAWEHDMARTDCRYVLVPPQAWHDDGTAHGARVTAALKTLLGRYAEAGVVGRRLVLYERR